MLKLLLPILVVIILGTSGFFLYKNLQTAPNNKTTATPIVEASPSTQTQTKTPPASTTTDPCDALTKGSTDLPPLYSGVTWQKPIISSYEVLLTDDSKIMNGCLMKSSITEFNKAYEVRNYYTTQMINKNWINISSSDLPGEAGSDTWTKNLNYFYIEIKPTTKPNVEIVIFTNLK